MFLHLPNQAKLFALIRHLLKIIWSLPLQHKACICRKLVLTDMIPRSLVESQTSSLVDRMRDCFLATGGGNAEVILIQMCATWLECAEAELTSTLIRTFHFSSVSFLSILTFTYHPTNPFFSSASPLNICPASVKPPLSPSTCLGGLQVEPCACSDIWWGCRLPSNAGT